MGRPLQCHRSDLDFQYKKITRSLVDFLLFVSEKIYQAFPSDQYTRIWMWKMVPFAISHISGLSCVPVVDMICSEQSS